MVAYVAVYAAIQQRREAAIARAADAARHEATAGSLNDIVAIGGVDGIVRIVRVSNGHELAIVERRLDQAGRVAIVRSVAFDRAGRQLAIAYDDGAVRLWHVTRRADDSTTLMAGPSIDAATVPGLMSLAFSTDGATLASGGADRHITLCRTTDGNRLATTPTENGTCRNIAASPNGLYFAVSGFYGTKLFDAHTGAPVTIPGVPPLGMAAAGDFVARFTPDGQRLIAAGGDGLCHVWELAPVQVLSDPSVPAVLLSAMPRLSLGSPTIAIRDIAVAATNDRVRIAAVTMEGLLTLREIRQRAHASTVGYELPILWQTHIASGDTRATAVSISSDGSSVIVGRDDGHVITVGAEDGTVLSDLIAHDGSVTVVRAAPNRPSLVTAGVDTTAKSWKQEAERSWTLVSTMWCGGEAIGVAIRPTGDAAVVTARPSSVLWFSLPDGKQLAASAEPSVPWRPAISADGRRVAAGLWDRSIHMWPTPTALIRSTPTRPSAAADAEHLVSHTQLVLQETFDRSDGSRLASVSNDGTLRIWDVSDATENGPPTRRLLATFNADAGDAVTVASLPAGTDATATDNPAVVTGHGDGRVRLWDWRRLDASIEGQRAYQLRQRATAVSTER